MTESKTPDFPYRISIGTGFAQYCRYCEQPMYSGNPGRWAVQGDGGKACPESVRAGYPAHAPMTVYQAKERGITWPPRTL